MKPEPQVFFYALCSVQLIYTTIYYTVSESQFVVFIYIQVTLHAVHSGHSSCSTALLTILFAACIAAVYLYSIPAVTLSVIISLFHNKI